jgi:REP element-mobilizing transposase RayT
MARPLRIEYPDAFYHITSRGNERRAIFRSKGDYERFLDYFESATERYGARIHCFCLMPNHYHLLLETPRANLRRILHHLNTSYTNYFNAKTERVGHLFQGRYRAILVEKDTYALELSRYIHLNPVRAHLVREPSRYPWSTYLTYVEGEGRWGWVEWKFILGQLSLNEREARRRYQIFVREGMAKSFEDPLRKVVASTLLGTEQFIEGVRERFIKKATSHRDLPALRKLSSWPDLSSILRESERVFGKGTADSRRVALYLSHRLSGLLLGEIGGYFGGIGPSAVTQNTRRLEIILERDKRFLAEVQNLKKILSE